MLNGINPVLLQIYMDFFEVNTVESLEERLRDLYRLNNLAA